MLEIVASKSYLTVELENDVCTFNFVSPDPISQGGTKNHDELTLESRNKENQHTIDSITDLRKTLNAIIAKIGNIQVLTFDKTFDKTFN